MNREKNIQKQRFVACTHGARLLSIYSRTARRASASESGSQFHLSAGGNSRDRFPSVTKKHGQINLMRCGIFRGKVPPRKTQKTKTSPRNLDAIAPTNL
jgi:hypothetical protein